MLKRNIIHSLIAIIGGGVLVSSCGENSRGVEYMPDMYRGPAVETYQPIGEQGQISALRPAENTIPRGFMAYDTYTADQAGYDSAKVSLRMPDNFPTDSLTLADGAKLYGIFCDHCHGETGDGQGILVERGKYLGVPSYADRQINLGTIFHVVTYGKGIMGSHASQLTPEERWKVSQYVMNLKAALSGETTSADAETEGDTSAVAKQITQ